MPAKGAPTGIHEEVESDEQWEQLLQKEGLIVIDVYPKWSGFCKALVNNFKRLKNNSMENEVPLIFAAAQADSIEALKKYRGRCEPCFLMFGGGVMVGVERGVNVPCLNQTIMERLEDENDIACGLKERIEVTDPVIALLEEEERRLAEDAAEMDEIIETEVTFCIIKPDAVENGLAPDILARMGEDGITILRQEERQLTEEQARCIYGSYELQDFFEGLINYICSGTSILMAIARGDCGVIADFREMIGPNNVEEARQNNPDCYRALFGTTNYQNAIHSSDSIESACRELAFFFPDFTNPVRVKEKPKMENTLCIIRPEAVLEFVDDIKEQIMQMGFEIVIDKEIEMSEEQFDEFYSELDRESDYYEILKEQMTCGVAVVMMIRKLTGIEAFKEALGPKELSMPSEEGEEEEAREEEPKPPPESEKPIKKKKSMTESDSEDVEDQEEEVVPFVPLREAFRIAGISINLIHGSGSAEDAVREIAFFWPLEHTFMIVKPGSEDHMQAVEKTVIDAGLVIAARKTMQLCLEEVELIYSKVLDEEFYPQLQEYMTSGMVQVYLIAGNSAVQRLRVLAGPVNHEEAVEKAPDSLRARFGTDTLRNGIHASSSVEDTKEMMNHFFGTDLDFDEEGRLDLKAALEKHHTRDDGDLTLKSQVNPTVETIKETDNQDNTETLVDEESRSILLNDQTREEGEEREPMEARENVEMHAEKPAEGEDATLASEANGAPPPSEEPPFEAVIDSAPPPSEEPLPEAVDGSAPPPSEEPPPEDVVDNAPPPSEEPPPEAVIDNAPPPSEEPLPEAIIDDAPPPCEEPTEAVIDGAPPPSEEPLPEAVDDSAPPPSEEPPPEAVVDSAPPPSEEPPPEAVINDAVPVNMGSPEKTEIDDASQADAAASDANPASGNLPPETTTDIAPQPNEEPPDAASAIDGALLANETPPAAFSNINASTSAKNDAENASAVDQDKDNEPPN